MSVNTQHYTTKEHHINHGNQVNVITYTINALGVSILTILANIAIFATADFFGLLDNLEVTSSKGMTSMNIRLIIQAIIMYFTGSLISLYLVLKHTNLNIKLLQSLAWMIVIATLAPLIFLEASVVEKLILGSMHLTAGLIVIPRIVRRH